MDRILLLYNKYYPSRFDHVDVTPPTGMTKISYIEQSIINALNHYNSKLNVSHIEYLDIKTQFPEYVDTKSTGLLIEEFNIDQNLASIYMNNGCYVSNVAGNCICRRIMMYMFVSEPTNKTRNGFISETVFPAVVDYAEQNIDSPSYTFANHKFVILNIYNRQITSPMILRHLVGFYVAGMDYIDVFNNNSFDPKQAPLTVKAFLELYSSDFASHYDAVSDKYEDDDYLVEFSRRVFHWKTAAMIADLVPKPGNRLDFHGSNEKYYWIEPLPLSLFAYKQGYKIDYSEYSDFILNYRPRFSPTSDKFARCEIVLEYIKKYFI